MLGTTGVDIVRAHMVNGELSGQFPPQTQQRAVAVGTSYDDAFRHAACSRRCGHPFDEANTLFGLRLNVVVMSVVLVGAVAYLVVRRDAGREEQVEPVAQAERAAEPVTGRAGAENE